MRSHAGQVRYEALENFIINIIQELFNEKPLSIFITHCLVKGLLLFRARPLPQFMDPGRNYLTRFVSRDQIPPDFHGFTHGGDVKIGQLLIPGI